MQNIELRTFMAILALFQQNIIVYRIGRLSHVVLQIRIKDNFVAATSIERDYNLLEGHV